MLTISELAPILCCPRCRSPLLNADKFSLSEERRQIHCSDPECRYSKIGFPTAGNQPVLIDFEASIFDEEKLLASNARSLVSRDHSARRLKSRIRRVASGKNKIAEVNCERFIKAIKEQSAQPRVLIIGGGTIGSGADLLYSESSLQIFGIDVYASANTLIVADGHHLPLCDGSIDGVLDTGRSRARA